VLAVDLDTNELAALPVRRLAIDLTLHEAPAAVVAAGRELGGEIDFLINNAGVGGSKALAVSDDALLDRILDTNLRAVLRLTRDVLPQLRDGGAIVNVASVFGESAFRALRPTRWAKAGISAVDAAAGRGPFGAWHPRQRGRAGHHPHGDDGPPSGQRRGVRARPWSPPPR